MSKQRTYRNYRGVKIYRHKEMVCGSDFDVSSRGQIVAAKPQYEISYHYTDGPLHDDLESVKIDIDNMINMASRFDGVEEMIQTLNSETK